MANSNTKPDFLPEIHFGKIGILKVHQISDQELYSLEQGSGESLFLNFGIGVLSVAISFLISLLTTSATSVKLFCVFVVVTVVGFLSGLVFMILWWRTRISSQKLAKCIRDRMSPQGDAQPMIDPGDDSNKCSEATQ